MKDTLLSSFLLAIIVSGLIFISTSHIGTVTASTSAALPTAPRATIADTNSVYSLQYTHQTILRLPNGTIVATFSSNLLGNVNNMKSTLFQVTTTAPRGILPRKFPMPPEWTDRLPV